MTVKKKRTLIILVTFIFRSGASEWDELVQFAMRKAERFVKTVAIEVSVPSWITGDNEVYAPRFLDEVADEIDVLEDKKDTLFCKYQFNYFLASLENAMLDQYKISFTLIVENMKT